VANLFGLSGLGNLDTKGGGGGQEEKNLGAKGHLTSRSLITIGQGNSQLTPHHDFESILPTSIKKGGKI
jgi:hypothetical protein